MQEAYLQKYNYFKRDEVIYLFKLWVERDLCFSGFRHRERKEENMSLKMNPIYEASPARDSFFTEMTYHNVRSAIEQLMKRSKHSSETLDLLVDLMRIRNQLSGICKVERSTQ